MKEKVEAIKRLVSMEAVKFIKKTRTKFKRTNITFEENVELVKGNNPLSKRVAKEVLLKKISKATGDKLLITSVKETTKNISRIEIPKIKDFSIKAFLNQEHKEGLSRSFKVLVLGYAPSRKISLKETFMVEKFVLPEEMSKKDVWENRGRPRAMNYSQFFSTLFFLFENLKQDNHSKSRISKNHQNIFRVIRDDGAIITVTIYFEGVWNFHAYSSVRGIVYAEKDVFWSLIKIH